jgi:pyridoxamine 5'-phosphate oxidase
MAAMPFPSQFLADPLPAEPLALAAAWLAEATALAAQPNPNSMVLATVGADGQPSARVVLCKDIVPQPGYVSFFTNYHSRKGREIDANARAALVLHWDHLRRQVRIEGRVERAPVAESEAYFAARPWQRRVGAWASRQSEPVGSRADLEAAVVATAQRLGVPVPGPEDGGPEPAARIPRPPHWGGYHLLAESVELWVEGESRIHDRARWVRPHPDVAWTVTRLQP